MLEEAIPYLPDYNRWRKGQLSAAMKSIEKLGLRGRTTIIGIAKRLEEIYFPGDSVPVYIDKNSYSLKLIQQIRTKHTDSNQFPS